jgi:hypothetical protein
MTFNQGRRFKRAEPFITAVLLASGFPAQASAVFLPATDELKFVSDSNPGIYVEYGVGKTYLLWNDEDVKNLSNGEDNSGHADTWSLWNEDWGPRTKRIALAIRKWRELPMEKQMSNIKAADRQKWKKDMFATTNSPKRYPTTNKAEPTNREGNDLGYRVFQGSTGGTSGEGCPPGTSYYERREGAALFGIKLGEGKLTWSGCLTDGEAAAAGAGTTTYSRPYFPPVPTYQAPLPIRCTTQYGVTTCY